MTTPRHGLEAVENAMQNVLREMMRLRPPNSTGIYVNRDHVSFGFRSNRTKAPDNFIFFDAPPAPAYDYCEPIDATRITADDGDLIQLLMNPRQAHTLYRLSRHISGQPAGPRGTFDALLVALRSVGADEPRDASLHTVGTIHLKGDE